MQAVLITVKSKPGAQAKINFRRSGAEMAIGRIPSPVHSQSSRSF